MISTPNSKTNIVKMGGKARSNYLILKIINGPILLCRPFLYNIYPSKDVKRQKSDGFIEKGDATLWYFFLPSIVLHVLPSSEDSKATQIP